MLALAGELSEDQLPGPGHFAWTGKNPLVTDLGADTASYDRLATNVLRRWLKKHVGQPPKPR